jgi:hypothetical protein
MVEAVEVAMNAYLASWRAETAARALEGQGNEVWTQLDREQPDVTQIRGVSQIELGNEETSSMEKLSAVVSKRTYTKGLLHILKDTNAIYRSQETQREADVTQGRLEVNTLEQRLAAKKAELRSAQLALEGAQATLGTAF